MKTRHLNVFTTAEQAALNAVCKFCPSPVAQIHWETFKNNPKGGRS